MSHHALLTVRRFIIGQIVVTVLLIFGVWLAGYDGRVALRDSQIAGCERGKLDRAANAEGWRAAETARRASGTPVDLRAATLYNEIADSLERRARITCSAVFPAPSLLPDL